MVIVNQAKDEIINFDNINNIFIFYDNEVKACGNVEDSIYSLGKYESEERAKEVLQEIIDMYKFNRCEAVGQKNAVYRMPEK